MRAATWATNRDIAAARLSWERAQSIADALPTEDVYRTSMRIAPRTMLCGTAWRVHTHVAGARFDELRQLCTAAGDKASLAIAMAGLGDGSRASGPDARGVAAGIGSLGLIESVGDRALTVGLSLAAIYAKLKSGEYSDVLRWAQRVIDLADGDTSKGGDFLGVSPLALALGRPGWRDDQRHGLAMAHGTDPLSYAGVVTFVYGAAITSGVLRADDSAVRGIEDALQIAERSADDFALTLARMTLGYALVHRQTAGERDRGQQVLAEVSEVLRRPGYNLGELPIVEVYVARERARRGDRDEALALMLAAVDHLFRGGLLLPWGVPATGVLVETLLERGDESDVAEAEAAIIRLADAPADDGLVIREIWLLRLRALLARARGDEDAYRDYRDRYRAMATELGFEGHMAMAEAMT